MARFKLKVDGTDLIPNKIQKMKYDREPIWSENTRRNSSALMTGKIKAWKWHLDVSYAPSLTQSEHRVITNALANNTEWHRVIFTDDNGQEQTKNMYVGSISTEPYWFVDGKMMYQSVNITLIEQ